MLRGALFPLAILTVLSTPAAAFELQTGGLPLAAITSASNGDAAAGKGNTAAQGAGQVRNPAAIPLLFAAQRLARGQGSGKAGNNLALADAAGQDAGSPPSGQRRTPARNGVDAARGGGNGFIDGILETLGVGGSQPARLPARR